MSSVSQTEGYPEDWGAGVYIDESTRDAILERTSEQFDWEDMLPEIEDPADAKETEELPKHHYARNAFIGGAALLAAGGVTGYATMSIRNRRR